MYVSIDFVFAACTVDATVVQVTLSPKNFVQLMKDPEGTGKSITQEATIIDQE